MATKLNFLQYTYRFRTNHKTLYSQTFPGPHFGSWTIAVLCPYNKSIDSISVYHVYLSTLPQFVPTCIHWTLTQILTDPISRGYFSLHDDVIKWKHFPRNWPFVPGEFPTQRPVTRSLDVFFDLRLNKRLSKQSWGWWFVTLSRLFWRQCNELTHGWQP